MQTTDSPIPTPDPTTLRWSETLHDHSHVVIRHIVPQDREAERAFIEGLSDEARQMRFMGQVRHPSEATLDRFTRIDTKREAAFVAVTMEDAHELIVGVSRYSGDPDTGECECAVTVTDRWQNKGLGTLLMEHLIDVARTRGMKRMVSVDSVENVEMRDLAEHLGFTRRIDPEDATLVIHELVL